jgi:hypothetical protein
MKKIISILILSLLLSGNAYAKVKTVEKNDDYIILKYSSLLKLKQKKLTKLLYKTMMVANDHCNSVGKSAYWFLGYTHGDDNQTKGIYMLDGDLGKNSKSYYHRIICSKDLQGALRLFKNRVANYNSDLALNIRPREYLINALENRKKIPPITKEKKKKSKVKEKSLWTVTEKKDEFEGTINRFLISSKSFPNKSLDFPYENTNAVIGVGCQSKSYFWIYINFNEVNLVGGEFIDDKSAKYNLRVKHNDTMVSISLKQNFGSKTLFVSEKYKNQFLEWLEKEDEIMVEFEHYGDGARYYKFKTTGFKTTFKKNCR